MKEENVEFKMFFILLIYIYLIVGNILLQKIIRISEATYNQIILVWGNLIFYFVLGILLTIPFFLSETKKEGNWMINYKCLLAFILPLFVVVFLYLYPILLDLSYVLGHVINALSVVAGYSLIFIVSKNKR
ncbi:hypothetical protein [Thermoanaerobacter wiegelii]|uniref:Uncharacterized protein n=1 Tax=Thermoanaerobacter wiegelii Rt8.B1 TaxID=697303 RepID=G2MW68_9THEO|nr:hypothetical protein [Thermoanaerobacter wiegelii]AEM77956.1 hypothetical protein Thewi_0487 [Thermoanaerobacter wiegelii Rt8.B1]